MDYTENFHGIRYSAKRGETLEIRAFIEDTTLNSWNGILHLMNKNMCGRTALFINDCEFFQGNKEWVIKVIVGTPSYMKELSKISNLSKEEVKLHNLGKLW